MKLIPHTKYKGAAGFKTTIAHQIVILEFVDESRCQRAAFHASYLFSHKRHVMTGKWLKNVQITKGCDPGKFRSFIRINTEFIAAIHTKTFPGIFVEEPGGNRKIRRIGDDFDGLDVECCRWFLIAVSLHTDWLDSWCKSKA